MVRIVVTLFIVLFFLNSRGQNSKISMNISDKSVAEVFEILKQEYAAEIAYDYDILSKMVVNVKFSDLTLKQATKYICDKCGLDFKYSGDTFLIFLKDIKHNVSGFVFDKSTNEKLVFASLLVDKSYGTTSNNLGFYSFNYKPTDSVRVRISYTGYEPTDTVLKVDKNRSVNYFLKSRAEELKEINVVKHTKKLISIDPQNMNYEFAPAYSSSLPLINDSDLLNAITHIPGVFIPQDGTSGLSLRGNDSYENIIMLDGFRIFQLNHLLGNISTINAKYVKKINIYKSYYPANHGGKTGGMIQMTGKSGDKNRYSTDFTINMLNLNLLTEIPVNEKFSFVFAARRSYNDFASTYFTEKIVNKKAENDDETISTDFDESNKLKSLNFYDINSKLTYKIDKKQNIEFNLFTSHDNADKEYRFKDSYVENTISDYKMWDNNCFSLNWNYQHSNNHFISINSGYSNFESHLITEFKNVYHNNPGYDIQKNDETNRVENFYMNYESAIKSGIKYNVKFGATYKNNRLDINSENGETVEDDSESNELTAFVQNQFFLTKKLSLNYGLRATYYDLTNKIYPEHRLNIKYAVNDRVKVTASHGNYIQFLTGISNLQIYSKNNFNWALAGNNDNKPQKSVNNQIGIYYNNFPFTFGAEAFYNFTENKKYTFNTQNISNYSEEKSINQSNAYSTGIDFIFNYKSKYFETNLSYTISESMIKSGTEKEYIPSETDQNHKLTFINTFRFKKNNFSVKYTYASGKPDFYYDGNGNIDWDRLINFKRFDISYYREFQLKNNIKLSSGVSILNVFNSSNISDSYIISNNKNTTYKVESIKFTPTFFISIKF